MDLLFLKAIISSLFLNLILYEVNGFDGIPMKTCSRELTRRLSRVCENRFNTMQRYISIKGPQPRRVRRQVVDECCKQACTDATIKLYCMNPQEQPAPSAASLNKIPVPKSMGPKETLPPAVPPRLRNQEIRIGTVAPEFNRIAVTAPLYRASFYRSYN